MHFAGLIIALVVCAAAETLNENSKIRYDNYAVYKISIKNESQLAILDFLQANKKKYNIWRDYDETSKEIDVMVGPQEVSRFLRLLKYNHFESKRMIKNVQEIIGEEANRPNSKAARNTFGWTRYHTLQDMEQWLDEMLAAHPAVTDGFTIGKSHENRTIRGIKISYKSGNPGIFIESNIHAREWVTSASATWFINELLTSSDKAARNLAENFDWYIIPVLNVDGFVYSHETDRMWRKTRQPIQSSKCIGADPNRNFNSYWMANNGASSNPCDETFAGSKPFSEPETAALANYVSSIKDQINIYLSFHSYGQLLLSPYGHTATEFPENYADMQQIGKAFQEAIAALPYKTLYSYGSTASVLYVASGTSVDWAFNTLGIKLGYTIEFRDKNQYGFVLPPAFIVPNSEELMAGVIAMVGKAKELNYV